MFRMARWLIDWTTSFSATTAELSPTPDDFLRLLSDNGGWISALEFDCTDELTTPLIQAGLIERYVESDRCLPFSLTEDGYRRLDT